MTDAVDRLKSALADRYAIERELGAGGMATVYLAHDLKHDRKVAIKVMRPELSAILGGERFLREVSIAAKLNHPHILALHDSGEAEEFLYYVMPHVEGESLRDKLNREKQLSVDEAISITKQVGAALNYAHEQGVIHRDIKPENILIHQGEALVADFGIALAVTAAGGTRITDTGLSLGTPEYMSPEQATAERELDSRSDVYSLGAVTYEMLVGEPPHTGKTVQAIIAKKLAEPILSVRVVRETVPEALDQVVTKALAKTPADRYDTTAEFCEALSGECVAEVTPRLRMRERSRLWWTVVIALAVAVLGLSGWWLYRTLIPRSTRMEWVVVLQPENLMGDSTQDYVVSGMHVELISKLGQIPGLNVTARQSALAYRGTNKTIPEIARELNVDAVVTSQMMKVGDSVRISTQLIEAFPRERQRWEGTFTESLSDQLALYNDVALGIADQIQVTLSPEQRTRLTTARSVDPQAYDAYLRGTFELLQLTGGREIAVQHFQRAIEREPDWAPPYAGLAQAYGEMGSWFGDLSAEEALTLAEPAVTRALELDESLAEAHVARGFVRYMLEWDWPGAESAFRRAIVLDSTTDFGRWQYANYLTHMGRFDESISMGEQTLEADPLSPLLHNELGYALHLAGRVEEALEAVLEGLKLDPDDPQSLIALALTVLNMGRVDSALAEARKVVPFGPPYSAWAGYVIGTAGRRAEALEILEELTRRSDAGEELVSPVGLAVIHVGLGHTEEALELLNEGYREHDPLMIGLKVNSFWDPLRSDPRFQDLLRRMSFPER